MKRIVIIGGTPRSLVNFRGPLLKTMAMNGHDVHAIASGKDELVAARLNDWGVTYHPIRLSRAGLNPLRDLHTVVALIRQLRTIRPHIVLSYTIKPVIYGGLAASIAGIPSIYSWITGLGYSFIETGTLRKRIIGGLACALYRLSLRFSNRVFFQNHDDSSLFLDRRLVRPAQVVVVNGSGVDLHYFSPSPLPEDAVFLLIGRLLIDKGIREYIKAAMSVKGRYPHARFQLAGALDSNPASISPTELASIQSDGIIEYLGYLPDVRPALAGCRIYVLPSYREGTPRTVLEAMASGRPIITTDAPGCRETVLLTEIGKKQQRDGLGVMECENGFLIRPRDSRALAEAMISFLARPDIARPLARSSREIAENKYDVNMINELLLQNMSLQ